MQQRSVEALVKAMQRDDDDRTCARCGAVQGRTFEMALVLQWLMSAATPSVPAMS